MVSFSGAYRSLLNIFGIEVQEDENLSVSRNPFSYAPVWYAVNKIGGHIGYLPLDIRREEGRNIIKDRSHPSYRLFRWQTNGMQSPLQFKRSLTADALLWGNGFAYIYKVRNVVRELVPIYPGSVVCELKQGRKTFTYFINEDDPIVAANPQMVNRYVEFKDEEILHIAGLGTNGVWGYSLLTLAREAWNAGMGGVSRLNALAKKGYAGGLMLNAPAGTSISRDAKAAKQFLDDFRSEHTGADKAGVVGLLREGVTAQVMQMSNTDAQFIETMKHLRQEEALRFMLESILGDDSSVSYNSLEQKNLAYLQNCLNTWLATWEEECDRKLLSESEQNAGYFHKFNVGPLLRSDLETTMRSVSVGITSRVLSPNEAREMLDRNPYDGGDEYLNPAIDKVTTRDGQIDTEPSRQSTSNVTQSQIEHMIQIEGKRIAAFAKSSGNFIKRIELFYQKWEIKLADHIERLGGSRDAATLHCQQSLEQLINLSGGCNQEELAGKVQELVNTWSVRSLDLLEEMELLNV